MFSSINLVQFMSQKKLVLECPRFPSLSLARLISFHEWASLKWHIKHSILSYMIESGCGSGFGCLSGSYGAIKSQNNSKQGSLYRHVPPYTRILYRTNTGPRLGRGGIPSLGTLNQPYTKHTNSLLVWYWYRVHYKDGESWFKVRSTLNAGARGRF